MRIKLVIVDSDEIYINKLIKYFTVNYIDKLEVSYFTEIEELNNFLKSNKIDVIIASESFGVEIKDIPEKVAFIYFSDSPTIETIDGVRTVCKFQKIDLIYKEILSVYAEKITNLGYKTTNDGSTKILAFLSCSGGTGSSTVAAACAMNLARRGKKTLYLNLESFGSANIFFNAEGNFSFDDIIYSIKGKKSNLSLKLESNVKKDITGVYFYDPCKIVMDIMEMDEEDLKKLFNELKIYGGYDYIIVDADFDFSEESMVIYNYADNIIFVSDGSNISNLKFQRAFEAMAIIDEQQNFNITNKILIIYNKFSNRNSKYIENDQITVIGGIQRFEGAIEKEISKQISIMSFFEQL